MGHKVIVLVEQTGEEYNAFLDAVPIYSVQFVVPDSQQKREFDLQELQRNGLKLTDIFKEYEYWNDIGYEVVATFDKEDFYLKIDEYENG